jgi:beta-phosphoglucomutase-like phosphatase (HAD superfamily)
MITVAGLTGVRAAIFDFNGTITEIYTEPAARPHALTPTIFTTYGPSREDCRGNAGVPGPTFLPRQSSRPCASSREDRRGNAGAGALRDAIVTIEDLNAGKPDPEGFLLALDLLKRRWQATVLGSPPLEPDDVVVFEDSPYGIAAAHAAGMRCVAAHLTAEPTGLLVGAVVDTLGPELPGP